MYGCGIQWSTNNSPEMILLHGQLWLWSISCILWLTVRPLSNIVRYFNEEWIYECEPESITQTNQKKKNYSETWITHRAWKDVCGWVFIFVLFYFRDTKIHHFRQNILIWYVTLRTLSHKTILNIFLLYVHPILYNQ